MRRAQALTDGDAETLAATLAATQTSVVQELAAVATESAASINPAIARLQMLDALGQAGDVRLSAGLIDLTGEQASALL